MKVKVAAIFLVTLLLTLAVATPALAAPPDNPIPGKPDFSEHIYADGMAWGTKVGPVFKALNDHNAQSFELIFVFTNGSDGQLPVAEAGPRNPAYNGGRWNVQVATWIGGTPMVLMSYEEVMDAVEAGYLSYESANFYFECPLLPVKE